MEQSETSIVEQQVEEPSEWLDEEVSDAKVWYDWNARQRTFEVGEQVLVLLAAQKDKLLAEWQGPYTIHKRITDVTYEIIMPEKQKKNHIFHVNMLARWKSPTAACLVVEEAKEETITGKELSTWPSEPDSTEPEIGPDLSEQQKLELWYTVKKHRRLFQDSPGRTNPTQIRIERGNAAPIHLSPYRLPKARHQAVQNEVQQLLRPKIIEPSTSPWASPIVLVPKRGGAEMWWYLTSMCGL